MQLLALHCLWQGIMEVRWKDLGSRQSRKPWHLNSSTGITWSESDFSKDLGIVKFVSLHLPRKAGKVNRVIFWWGVMHAPPWAAAHMHQNLGCACHTNIRNLLWLMTAAVYILCTWWRGIRQCCLLRYCRSLRFQMKWFPRLDPSYPAPCSSFTVRHKY